MSTEQPGVANEIPENDQAATVTPGDAAKLTGVDSDTIRYLARAKLLPGAVRGDRGSLRIRSDRLPTVEGVERILRELVTRSLREVRTAFNRVSVELEAVNNDIAELEDDPDARIGIDLDVFDSLTTSEHSTLRQALSRLTFAKMNLQTAKRHLDDITRTY